MSVKRCVMWVVECSGAMLIKSPYTMRLKMFGKKYRSAIFNIFAEDRGSGGRTGGNEHYFLETLEIDMPIGTNERIKQNSMHFCCFIFIRNGMFKRSLNK